VSEDKNATDDTKIFGFQIHHILPLELFENLDLSNMLAILGISSEARSNKIALMSDTVKAGALRSASPTVLALLDKVGFGTGPHLGSHPGYSDFFTAQLRAISNKPITDAQKYNEAKVLFEFMSDVSAGKVSGVDVKSSITEISAHYDLVRIDGSTFDRNSPPNNPEELGPVDI
jgi:hypothetical protein